ncbi:MAG: chemotaxis protein CheW [Hylemonella sp.]|nr:chemotaxis protein CheW [Hylemonella sp.]
MDMQLPVLLDDTLPVEAGRETPALACVLEYAQDSFIALPVHAGVELVDSPRLVPVPGMAHFCRGLVAWQGRQLPLIDLQAYLGGVDAPAAPPFSHVLVVAYQVAPGVAIEYGALCAPFLIRMVEVVDSDQSPLPDDQACWTRIAISCFLHRGRAIPVLEPSRMFTSPVSPAPP